MKQIFKSILPLVLALVLVLTLAPGFAVEADAATTDFANCTVTGLGLSATDATDSGTANWVANGATITGKLNGSIGSSWGTAYVNASTTTLTLTNNKQKEAELSFNYKFTQSSYKDETVSFSVANESTVAGQYKTKLSAGASVVITMQVKDHKGSFSITGGSVTANNAEIEITGLSLTEDNSVSISFGAAQNGSYSVAKADGTAVDITSTLAAMSTDRFNLTATPVSGYAFSGWYFTPTDGTETFYSGTKNAQNVFFAESGTLSPRFVPADSCTWDVEGAVFDDFEKAVGAAKTTVKKTIVLAKNHTLTEDLTIPEEITVLIPFDDAYTVGGADPEVLKSPSGNQTPQGAYRTLTMATGTTLTVKGALEVGAKHHASHGGSIDGGTPYDFYGKIVMENGSAIQVNKGGSLYAWGYITGTDAAIAAGNVTATVTARNGGKIYEKMQVSDYRGGNITSAIVLDGCFPFNQYYIQNVEVKEVLEYGSTLIAHAGIYGNGVEASSVSFMGSSDAMFALGSGTKVTKFYDHKTDRLVIDVEGDISMNAISIMGYNTSQYILPFNHNIAININSGTATLNQDIMFQPGATANVAEGAKLVLASGKKVILMDNDGWGNYCFGKQLQQISYVPYYKGVPGIRQAEIVGAPIGMGDATINVNGTFEVNGTMYASGSGAKIISTGETGVVNFKSKAATGNTTFKQSTVVSRVWIGSNTTNVTIVPAILTNGEGVEPATVDTKGITAGTVYTYCADGNRWTKHFTLSFNANGGTGTMDSLTVDECCKTQPVVNKFVAPEGKYFAGWNTVATPTEENAGTAYNIADYEGGAIVFSGFTSDVTLYAQWKDNPKAIWMNGEEKIGETSVAYNTVPVFQGTAPTKDYDDDNHYVLGWSTTADGAAEELTAITEDATYYAVFTAEAHTYTDGKCACGHEEPVKGMKGDVDLNKIVDINDFSALAQHIGEVNFITDEASMVNADVTGDQVVDIDDFIKLAQYIGEVITDLN